MDVFLMDQLIQLKSVNFPVLNRCQSVVRIKLLVTFVI